MTASDSPLAPVDEAGSPPSWENFPVARPSGDWTDDLARTIAEDRVDRGILPDRAARMARRYRAWLASLVGKHDRSTCPEEALIRKWPGDLCFHTGQATVFVARQGAGKTNTLSYLIEKAIEHRPEWDVYANVPFPWDGAAGKAIPSPPNLHAVRSMTGLLRGIAETILADRVPAIAIDEMDQASTSHEWASERSESWTKFLFVERHFRVRGPLLAYHVYEHVPLPLRRVGDLRGSYFRVVVRGGERRLARVEDTSAWWVVRESVLPFLTLGLRGFSLDVNMADLENRLDGDRKEVARQMLEYLDELERTREAERLQLASGLSEAETASLLEYKVNVVANRQAGVSRDAAIMRALRERPDATMGELVVEFHTTYGHLQKPRQRVAAETGHATESLSVGGGEA